MTALFKATAQFDASDGAKWRAYTDWAKIPALVEVVSLDCILCPDLPIEIEDEDWKHIVNENFHLNYFCHLDYQLQRVSSFGRRNILGVYRNPGEQITTPPASGNFEFLGYDIIEEATSISAIVNCGGFPESFSNAELNPYGLISSFHRSIKIKESLAKLNPEEPSRPMRDVCDLETQREWMNNTALQCRELFHSSPARAGLPGST